MKTLDNTNSFEKSAIVPLLGDGGFLRLVRPTLWQTGGVVLELPAGREFYPLSLGRLWRIMHFGGTLDTPRISFQRGVGIHNAHTSVLPFSGLLTQGVMVSSRKLKEAIYELGIRQFTDYGDAQQIVMAINHKDGALAVHSDHIYFCFGIPGESEPQVHLDLKAAMTSLLEGGYFENDSIRIAVGATASSRDALSFHLYQSSQNADFLIVDRADAFEVMQWVLK